MLTTAYDTDYSTYKISPHNDIMFQGLHYTHAELRSKSPPRTRTELRVDPENPYKIYCCVGGKWVAALHSKYPTFNAKSREVRWAEAIVVGEARTLRDEAKQDSHDDRAEMFDKFDASYIDRKYADIAMKDEIPTARQEFEINSTSELLDELRKKLKGKSTKSES